ncbi:MAG TPA: ADP-forming succinate--CoA ligase subunit beta [Dehalococcoidia bacterium]|nr:ADP-forming succinate--CoA ligase subunit beta [Dehalococcoidia bacterium]
MKIFEFEAKNILKKYGISVPKGNIASKLDEVETIATQIGKPIALKSQILVSSRGKAGGIKFVNDARGAKEAASNLFGSTIKGCQVDHLLVEEKLDIAAQLYASVAIDRQARAYIVLASTSGGVDIEEVAKASPEKISRHWVDITAGFSKVDAVGMLGRFSLDKDDAATFADTLGILYRVAIDYDAELVEINPLVKTSSGEFTAVDARIILDDNAVFRHPEFKDRSFLRLDDTPREAEARKQNLAYVDLDGDIGIIGNGAGLVMATIDLVGLFGGRPGNFLDLGGGGQTEITKRGIMLVLTKPETKVVLINILGGITRCDVVAEAIVQALNESSIRKPMAVRLIGTNEERGVQILRQAGINSYHSMEEAIEEVLRLKAG